MDNLSTDSDREPDKAETLKKRPKNFWGWGVAILFMLMSGYLGYLIVTISRDFNKEILDIKKVQNEQFVRHTETNQFLLSTIDWSSRRAQVILFMRDQIAAQWKKSGVKVNLDDAYAIAEMILKECENYTYIDPFLVLATQCIESNFTKNAVSPAGALGINQIMPSTGRLLAKARGMEYSDSLLFNAPISTRFAVMLFDCLYAQYNCWETVLADYNGGPWQAYYFRKEKSKMAEETKKYVPAVMNKKKEYDTLFVKFRIDERVKGS